MIHIRTAEQQVYDYLRDQILSGKLAGGQRLHQDEIAAQLGVSRMPVREAIRRLHAEGLVVNRPNRGAVVTTLGPEAILDLFEIRSVLEGYAAALAVPAMTPAALRMLEERHARMERARRNVTVWMQRHDEFHDGLCEITGRQRLAEHIRSLRASVAPYIRLYLSMNREPESAGFGHTILLDAIRAGDAPRTEQIMREHVMSGARAVVEFLRQSGGHQ